MKKIYILILVTFVSFQGFSQILDKAQDSGEKQDDEFKTLIKPGQSHGGYAGIYFNYGQLDNKDAIFIGGRGAWVIGHSIALGIGGTGFINELNTISENAVSDNYGLAGGYGGFTIEPIVLPKFPVHVSFPILLGAGGVAYTRGDADYNEMNILDSEAFFIVEPGLDIEFNLTRYFRLALGIQYRLTTDIGLDPAYNIKSDVLNGLSGGITFKIGKF